MAPNPPIAKKLAHTETRHGAEVVDHYHWMRGRDDPGVIAHLEVENAYMREVMRSTEGLQESLFTEMKARIKETDLSVPVRIGPYEYFSRTEEGKHW